MLRSDFVRVERDGWGPWATERTSEMGNTLYRIQRYLNGGPHEASTVPQKGLVDDLCFGCESLYDLELYFSRGNINHLLRIGFVVMEYVVPHNRLYWGEGEIAIEYKYLQKSPRRILLSAQTL